MSNSIGRGFWKTSFKKIILFLCFIFRCAGPALLHGLFSSCGKGGYSLVLVCGLLIAVASAIAAPALGHAGFSSYDMWVQELWLTGSGAQAQ